MNNNIEHFYENIEGWFTFPKLYSSVVKTLNDNSNIVEVGTWLGKSAAFMAVEIINSKKNINFFCVDTWQGSEEHKNYNIVKEDKLYSQFLKNIELVKDVITPVKMTSIDAAKQFSDNSLDFVFLDAAHDYNNVKNDILTWYPKVKVDGLLAGHDLPWEGVQHAVNNFLNFIKSELIINSELCWGILKKQ